jgi:hypothetical protein
MQVLRLVALACGACPDIILDRPAQVGRMEVAAQAVQGTLDAFMAVIMHCSEDFLE